MMMSAAPNKTGWVIGGIAGGMVMLVLAALLAVLLLVAARRRQRTVSISGMWLDHIKPFCGGKVAVAG